MFVINIINLRHPMTTTTHHAVLILSLFFVPSIKAQPGSQGTGTPTEPYPYAKFSPSMAIIIAVLVTALFFMGFFSIYIRRCSQSSTGGSVRATLSMRSRRAAAARGLEAAVIETFPTLAYSEVKGLKIGKGALECAVCLNEFEDDEMLRLLPKCDHVFHPECIDIWLASHTTCPVCRADLVPLPGESVVVPDGVSQPDPVTNESNTVEDYQQGEVRVTISADENEQLGGNNLEEAKPEMMKRGGSLRVNRPPRSGSVRSKLLGFGNKFPRSHSTGHSLVQPGVVQPGENVDRFTLRLPEEVRKEFIRRALNRTGSCAASSLQCEGSARKGYRTGNEEGSSRGKSYRRIGSLERVVKSDRWVFSRMPSFLSRALSVRSPKVVAGDGEASTSAGPAKAGGEDMSVKSDTAGLAANDSAKLPV